MSGRFLPGGDASTRKIPGPIRSWIRQSWTHAGALHRRLLAALAISLLAHALLILLPYLRGDGTVRNPRSPEGARIHYTMHATLAPDPSASPAGNTDPADAAPKNSENATPEPVAPEPPGSTGSGGLLPMPALAYYTTDQLTRKPRLIAEDPLDDDRLRLLSASGKVVLRLWVNDIGWVTNVEVERSDLPPEFATNVMAAFQRTRFAPGERDGLPVGSIIRIEVNYAENRRSAS